MTHMVKVGALALAVLGLVAAPAAAGSIGFTFTGTGGTTGPTISGTVSAAADFSWTGDQLTIVLSNKTTSIADITNVLDGISFTMTGGGTLSLNTPSGVSASFAVDCNDQATCQKIDITSYDSDQHDVPGSSPFDWGITGTTLDAGNGSLHPAGIVNSNIVGTSPNGSIDGNGPHNDLLFGPVTFFLTGTAPITGITAANFYWGTSGDFTPGVPTQDLPLPLPTPEPGSLFLMGSGLVLGARLLRRRFSS